MIIQLMSVSHTRFLNLRQGLHVCLLIYLVIHLF